MKPPLFRYHAPTSVEAAVELLALAGDGAAILSGGQSLMPMLNLRLANPSDVIDLRAVPGLSEIAMDDQLNDRRVDVGAMVTHHTAETDPLIAGHLPLAHRAAGLIGFRAIRNRGTVGGSIAHADPAAEWPAVLLALDGSVTLRCRSGVRRVASDEFFISLFTTARLPDELITGLSFAARFAEHWGFAEFQRRTGDFAVVAAAVACQVSDSVVTEARVVLAGIGSTPIRCPDAEAALVGRLITADLAASAAAAARDEVDPIGDAHGSADYRRRLVFTETQRAISEALSPRVGSLTHA
ncbi:MAG: xanthine dehydrogenase family protein subunit M [Ilumatobacteraceae bacterium]